MDTGTVLEIIKMLDAKISETDKFIKTDKTLYYEDIQCMQNQSWGLEQFREHLQDFIENEVSKAENQTGE